MAKSIEERLSALENQVGGLTERHIIEDLREKRYDGSDKPRYSYADIAKKNNVPTSRVQDIAKRNGLERRGSRNNTGIGAFNWKQ
ncbi:MAG: hypothetical protein IJR72_04720 [Oscillospiraceae bacterium]|nr:hypothetical protein [Oscillospiraceae bacterium]